MKLQKLKKEYYLDAVRLSEYAFQYKIPQDKIEEQLETVDKHIVYGFIDEDQLLAKLHMIPFETYMGDKKVKMGGIAGVATYPEYRRFGLVRQLIQHVLHEMKEGGYLISMLHPFFVKFYRKFGWELFGDRKISTLTRKDLVRDKEAPGFVKRFTKETHNEDIEQIYAQYAARYTGMLVRSRDWWENAVYHDLTAAVYYDENSIPTGYILYGIKNSKMEVEEFFPLNPEARTGLWNFICQHDSMIDELKIITHERESLFFTLPDPRFKSELKPFAMARIVDVEAFLKEYSFVQVAGAPAIVLNIKDEWASWNNNTFAIEGEEVTALSETDAMAQGSEVISIDINAFTALLFGYKSVDELLQIEQISGPADRLAILDQLIGFRQPFLADAF